MKRILLALGVVFAVFAATAGAALASNPVQSATQSSTTEQGAIAASSATQVQPSNTAYSVRVLSPGNDGAVNQANSASSSATAANLAGTTQDASQTQGSGCGCSSSPLQSTIQSAETGQLSGVLSGAAQLAAANQSDPASVASYGGNGGKDGTGQSNDVSSEGNAANLASTDQSATQAQSGSGVQSSDQSASTGQAAGATSSATQYHPSNSNISVRVLSPGNDGPVSQSNDASSSATAANPAGTSQGSQQDQSGSGVQSAIQSTDTHQLAGADSHTVQVDPSNSNISVRVLSPGNDGSVHQSNDASSSATAANLAPVSQTATQDPRDGSCGCQQANVPVQAIGQTSSTEQAAGAVSGTAQIGASNSSDPVRVSSGGDGGSLHQSNDASSHAAALNAAPTTQDASQQSSAGECGCSGGPDVQAIGQSAFTGQLGVAKSGVLQAGASNSSDPVRIWSDGNDGRVSQSNDASSAALAANLAGTEQSADQQQSGSGIQALGQDATTLQGAKAGSFAAQLPGKRSCGCWGGSFGNAYDPVRVGSDGYGGSVSQSNDASSAALAANGAWTSQTGSQNQGGSDCGCSGLGIQALGQQAATGQLGAAYSQAWQIGASNVVLPTDVWSHSDGGGSRQSNGAWSISAAPNRAWTMQTGVQME